MHRYLGISVVTAAVIVGSVASSNAEELRFTSWGGNFQTAQREIFLEAFKKETGISFVENSYQGGWGQFQAMADTGNIPWDVVEVESAELVRGCEQGLFVPIDWAKIGNKDDFIPGAATECGVGVMSSAYAFAYNRANVSTAPGSAKDFFDLAKFSGNRGIRNSPKNNLEFALIADGVKPSEIYSVLATQEGQDRAFAKLGTIKKNLQFYDATAQGYDWLVNGQVVFAMMFSNRIFDSAKEGKDIHLMWDGASYLLDSWVAIEGGNTEAAFKFMKVYSDPKLQAEFSKRMGFGPAMKTAESALDDKLKAYLPIGANLDNALDTGSETATLFWKDHMDDLTTKWNTWVASN
ncbi:ABC transporter substrate-binding protein [Bradyrhizobium sp. BRP14]|nr:ABC transporter substrate-binding protein [Bradyrhizobium sp. BRP14]